MSAELVPGARAHRLRSWLLRRVTPWGLLPVAARPRRCSSPASRSGVLWLSSTETRTVSSHLSASMRGIELRVRSGDVAIGAAARTEVSILRPDRCVLGHGPLERRSVRGGVLRISSGCARLVVGSCSASYRVAVPNDVPISIRIEHGTFGSTAIAALPPPARKVEDYCGFVLGAVPASGDVTVSTACSPERLTQR